MVGVNELNISANCQTLNLQFWNSVLIPTVCNNIIILSITIVIVIVRHIISFDHNCEKLSWILDDSTDVGTSHSGSPLFA